MSQSLMQSFNTQLGKIFSNGHAEVGLEVGADPGLNFTEYVQVPRSMIKHWCAKIKVNLWNEQHTNMKISKVSDFSISQSGLINPEEYKNKPGWVSSGKIRVFNGKFECQYSHTNQTFWIEIDEFHIEPPTTDDIRAFYSANQGHVKDNDYDQDTLFWVHSNRFWALVGGFILEDKNKEFTYVDNPTSFPADADDFVMFCMKNSSNSWTASAARATSWRRSNHATGGETLQGFPRRWCVKEGYLKTMASKGEQKLHERHITTAYYLSTHASSVHAVLSLMAQTDNAHFAMIDPSCGFIMNWDVGMSTTIRMAPKTQVAGTAVVVDSMVVLRMLISEGLAPLLVNIGQIQALKNAEDTVKQYGICCAVYAKWFLAGHPTNLSPIQFSQRDESFFELAQELSIIGTRYYHGSTISESASLQNISRQSSNEGSKSTWSMLATRKRDVDNNLIVQVVDMVKGNSVGPMVALLTSGNSDEQASGIMEYNSQLTRIAEIVGVPVVSEIRIA